MSSTSSCTEATRPAWGRAIVLAAIAAVGVFLVAVWTKRPLADRDWVDHLAQTPSVAWSEQGSAVSLAPIRDWQYLPLSDGIAILEAARRSGTFHLADLQEVWFFLEPHPGLPMMAHTFVVFDFGPEQEGGGGMVGLTIEARKVEGERYNPVLGALNKYELVYVWAEPRDLATRRATLLEHDLQAYKLALTPAQRRAYFTALVARTDALSERPRFYNTLRSNCTNELAKAAGLAWDPAFIFTGGAAKALHREGLIAGDDFAELEAAADFASSIEDKTWTTSDFNAHLRAMRDLDR